MATKKESKLDNNFSDLESVASLIDDIVKRGKINTADKEKLAAAAQYLKEKDGKSSNSDAGSSIGMFSWWVGTEKVDWNEALFNIFGLPKNEKITPQKYFEFVHPDDVETMNKVVNKAVQEKGSYRIRHRIVKGDGSIGWLDYQGKITLDAKNNEVLHGIVRESDTTITRKLDSGKVYQILSNHSSEIIAFTDLEGKIEDVNVAVFEQLGWFPTDLKGKSIWTFVHTDQYQNLLSLWEEAVEKPKYEWLGNVRLKGKSGVYTWFSVKALPIANEKGELDSMLLVAENAEKKTGFVPGYEMESRFSGISEEISEFAIIGLDANNRIRLWNKGAERIYNFKIEEVSGQDFLRFLKPSGIEKTSPEEIFENAFQSKKKKEWFGWMKVKDGQDFWGHVIINPQLTPDKDDILGFTLLVRNLSERKFSDARFQSFLEMGSDSTIIMDEKGKIFLVNRKTEETFGYPREELLGKSIDILVPDSYKDAHKHHRKEYFKDPQARPMGQGSELYAKRKNGEIFPVEISLSPVQTEKGLLVLSSVRDVSQRLENERKLRNAARELNLSYQRLQGIIDSSQDLIAAVDINYNFIAFNRAFKAYFDKEHDTNIQAGDNIKTIFSEAKPDKRVLEPYWEKALKGQEFSFELKVNIDGTREGYQNVTFNSIRDQNKRLLGAAHVIRDITEEFRQKEILKRSEDMLNDAQAFAQIGSFEYDIKLDEIYCSDAVFELLGIPKQKIKVDADLLRLVSVNDRKELTQAFITLIEEGKPFHKLLHVNRIDDGREIVISCSARSRITANANPGIIGVIQDETLDYKIQEELKQAKEKAEETAKLKQNFVANVSHEIRTPMNAILGFSRFLMEANVDNELKDYATNIYSSAENLLVLIDDILDFSKLEAGKVKVENTDFDLKSTIQQVYKLFKLKASQKNIGLEVDWDDKVYAAYKGDPYRINQMLINLVGNAIKFTEKGKITISVSVARETKTKQDIEIAVRDTGIGIPKEKLNSIFQSFSQAEGDTTRKYGGSGLGLSIVKNLLNILKGEISVDSEVGKGSEFTLKFPIKKGNPKNLSLSEKVDVEHKTGQGYSVLIAEDNLNNQIITAKLLRDVGFDVKVASNGSEAVDLYDEYTFDLILMDIQMPIMDGLEAMKQIKLKEKNKKSTPIIALTAHALVEEKERYLKAGMNDYVSKPFKPDELYQVVFKQLGNELPRKKGDKSPPVYEDNGASPAKNAENMKPDKPVDLAYLREMVGNDQDVVDEMIDIFKEDTPGYLKAIYENLNTETWEPIAKACHTLKSSIGFVGRSDLVELAKGLQLQKEKPADNAPIRDTLNYFTEEIEKVLEYLNANPEITKVPESDV
ncbi:PAS domain S-box protein [Luteibaculum oceani]|uniref:histidine kinase n=1 Tax=Luteibaculum oceani TaxID=1294296 RepID=A0A5C6VKQ0_9FLAO|nr:PAS domain S-box protein [Luteibaculum oceani]TXC85321.1 PAS domain S-box protein [Luteibaculum oceani]